VDTDQLARAKPQSIGTYAQTVGDEKREAGAKVASMVLVKKADAA
jgi:hypothetical protein